MRKMPIWLAAIALLTPVLTVCSMEKKIDESVVEELKKELNTKIDEKGMSEAATRMGVHKMQYARLESWSKCKVDLNGAIKEASKARFSFRGRVPNVELFNAYRKGFYLALIAEVRDQIREQKDVPKLSLEEQVKKKKEIAADRKELVKRILRDTSKLYVPENKDSQEDQREKDLELCRDLLEKVLGSKDK